jgi:Spy/CpxP family protein refolding chaperone
MPFYRFDSSNTRELIALSIGLFLSLSLCSSAQAKDSEGSILIAQNDNDDGATLPAPNPNYRRPRFNNMDNQNPGQMQNQGGFNNWGQGGPGGFNSGRKPGGFGQMGGDFNRRKQFGNGGMEPGQFNNGQFGGGQFGGQFGGGQFRNKQFGGGPAGTQFPMQGKQYGDKNHNMSSFRKSSGNRMFGALNFAALNLSDEQREKIKAMREQSSLSAKEYKRVLRAKRQEMKDLMFNPEATDAQIRTKNSQLLSAQNKLQEIAIDDFLSIRSVLTNEQRKRLPEIKPGGAKKNFSEGEKRVQAKIKAKAEPNTTEDE